MQFSNIKIKHIRNSLFNHKIITGLLIILIFSVVIFLSVFPEIFLSTQQIRQIQDTNIPVSTFSLLPSENSGLVIDEPIPSTGCEVPLSLTPGKVSYMQIKSGDVQRRFLVYLPESYNNRIQHALVVGFHGYHETPWNFEKYTHFDSIANRNNFIVVYPEGSKSVDGIRGWNTGLHLTVRTDDILFVSNMLNALQSNLCINPNQIYATGFSNGGGFTADLACKLSDRIAAFAPVSGSYLTVFNSCKTSSTVPILEFHGSSDKTVPYIGLPKLNEMAAFNWVREWATIDKCSAEPMEIKESKNVTKYKLVNCENHVSVTHYKIIGEGHQWPRVLFSQNINNHLEYTSATQTIWYFFKQNPLVLQTELQNKTNIQNF